MRPYSFPFWTMLFGAVILIAAVAWLGIALYRRYTGLSRGKAALLWLLGVALAVVFVIYDRQQDEGRYHRDMFDVAFHFACTIGLPLLGLPFLVRLHRKWIGGDLTDAEKSPGIDGIRAWLGAGNLICATLLAICLNQLFGVSFLAATALTFGLLLIYPLLMLATHTAPPAPVAPPEDLSHEREKVLQLLESGRVTADESAELLNALGQSVPTRLPAAKDLEMTPQRKLVLLGAALLLAGFFLPWFSINLGTEINAKNFGLMAMLQEGLHLQWSQLAQPKSNPDNPIPAFYARGSDISHGLGWWVLVLGVAAAVLPFLATNLSRQTQKKIMLICLSLGVFILIYLFSKYLSYVSVGILAGLAGYALELIGTLRERPALR